MLDKKTKRVNRVRAKVIGTPERPRLAVFRSLKHISAQIIDDSKAITLVSASDLSVKEATGTPVEIAQKVGEFLAQKAKEAKIKAVCFDRRANRYHGRIKALAEGARAGGLEL